MKLAFDRSARTYDTDGRLHLDKCHISKASINPYYGREIPGYDQLGLNPDKIYRLYRDPVELERAAPSFARLPILSEHIPVTADSPSKEKIIGSIGSKVSFDSPYLNADISIWDGAAIAGIEADAVKELSCAYHYVPAMTAGTVDGQAYDGIMTEIKGNHLALVETGRAGSDVVVADSKPFFGGSKMNMTKLGRVMFAVLSGMSATLAQDAALGSIVGNVSKKGFKKQVVRDKLIALDGSLDPERVDAVLDALLNVEQDPVPVEPPKDENPFLKKTEDEEPAMSKREQLRKLLMGKVDEETLNACLSMIAEDTKPDEDDDKKIKGAMDSVRREMRETFEAIREVEKTVGEVLGMDSASKVYAFALDQIKIDHEGIDDTKALRALYRVASRQSKDVDKKPAFVAQDAAGLVKMFPTISHIRQG